MTSNETRSLEAEKTKTKNTMSTKCQQNYYLQNIKEIVNKNFDK